MSGFPLPVPSRFAAYPWPPAVVSEMTIGNSNATQFPNPFIIAPGLSMLLIFLNITGYAGTDVVSLRFNQDSGANYWSRYVTLAAGGVTPLIDTPQASDTLLALGKPINKGRAVTAQIVNFNTRSKVANVTGNFGTGAAATIGEATVSGAGEWVNTTDYITRIDILTRGGLAMTVGSSAVLFGWNRPYNV